MVSPRRIRLHRGTRLESESDPGDVDMDVDAPTSIQASSQDSNEDDEGTEDGEGDDDADADADEDELESEQGVPSTTATSSAPSRLKITLKMPLPSRNDTPIIESEDEVDVLGSEGNGELYSEDEDEDEQQPKIKHPLTSRQAALASVLDPSHVTLESLRGRGKGRGRGRLIGEAEMKLRKEETARKRRNFVEKKLEDEKAETINRLLKKQSRPRGKRAKDSVAAPTADPDSDEGIDEEPLPNEPPPTPPPPMMYRWISTSRAPTCSPSTEPRMVITFSIPQTQAQPREANSAFQENIHPVRPTSCAAPGCSGPFRYRLVKDWTRGACGIECLKVLEGTLAGV